MLADVARRHDAQAHALRQRREALQSLKERWAAGDASAALLAVQRGRDVWSRPCVEQLCARLEKVPSPVQEAAARLAKELLQEIA